MLMDRFLRYTSGKEPVITVNLVAAVGFGVLLTVLERAGITLSETELVLLGSVFLVVATWLARAGVFSPDTYHEDVDAALHEPPPEP
jgi:hypothetical protein